MDFDVVVAGAGPVGLLLACELAVGGASVVVLERRPDVDQTMKAGAVGGLAAEALVRLGLGERLERVQWDRGSAVIEMMRESDPELDATLRAADAEGRLDEVTSEIHPFRRVRGHFGGLYMTRPPSPAEEAERAYLFVAQQEIEYALADRARELGVPVWREHPLDGFRQDEDGVAVEVGGLDVPLRAGYLVGCDGGRSLVRKLAGFDFPGTEPTITGHQAIVDLDEPDKLLPMGWRRTATGVLAYGPVAGRVLTVEFDGPPADRDVPITAEEIEASLRRVSGTDVRVTAVRSATRFTDNARRASTYRKGRVLLAGDAAHVHPPFGGQGLTLGLMDAANLGWKLAATVAGWAPDGLLDTYTAERRLAAERVLQNNRAQVALMRPGPQTTALREVFAEMMEQDEVLRFLQNMLSGREIRYPVPDDAHPFVGWHMNEGKVVVEGREPASLAELMGSGRGVLLDFGYGADVAGWSDRVDVFRVAEADRTDLSAVLIRRDGYVAWAADWGEPNPEGLAKALHTWFGAPLYW
ncbi:FAD-dependent oxidoreductase [Longimycelium tulufanense]|uniref:FAD-dependent oxidoreductase n=1 Tax=Longimycelium tulufanense TaxID=907463 RepID=A0A8J3C6U2_9PSEU|nr:FAD-dependent monooxygenase [Longimycelium tulufanense]GGM43953.1 FAD-dependent oxidoreductase [Longimycelium tulufanense]